MDYTMAETIAHRLAKMSPWVRTGSMDAFNEFECPFCHATRAFGFGDIHDPECLWLNARQYAGERKNATVTSQEDQDSPIEARVDELLAGKPLPEINSNRPAEWAAARRVSVILDTEDGPVTWHGWQLAEDIEGGSRAGQIWFDGRDESIEPAGDWLIDDE